MGTKTSQGTPRGDEPAGDPWAAFGYLVAGVLFYGGIGFGLSVWLDASYWLPIGILAGAGFGMYMVFARYRYRGDPGAAPAGPAGSRPTTLRTPIDNDRPDERDAPRLHRPDGRDDRGDSP